MTHLADLEAVEAGLIALHRLTFQHQAWEDIQRRAGFSMDRANAALLKVVAGCTDAPCRLQTIAQQLGIEAPSVTRTVQELEEAGLLARKPDQDDGRASNVSLTTKGERQLAKLQAARRERLALATKDWSKQDLHTLGTLLQRFAADMATKPTETK